MTSLSVRSLRDTVKSSLTIFLSKLPALDELDGGVAMVIRTVTPLIGEGVVSGGGAGLTINSSKEPGVLETEVEDFAGVVAVGNCRGMNSGASFRRGFVGTENG